MNKKHVLNIINMLLAFILGVCVALTLCWFWHRGLVEQGIEISRLAINEWADCIQTANGLRNMTLIS